MNPSLRLSLISRGLYADWDDLVATSRGGTVYHGTPWLEVISKAVGDEFAVYGIYNGEELIGGIATQDRRRGPLALARRPFATPYTGIVWRDGVDKPDSTGVARLLADFSGRYSHTTVTQSPFGSPLALPPGWENVERATYLVDIESSDQLWRNIASEVRNRIRNAEKRGIAVVQSFDPMHFYKLFTDLFAHQGADVPLNERRFVQLINEVVERGIGTPFLAVTDGGTPCAACLLLHDRHRVYYSLAASHLELRKNGAPSLLLWEALKTYEGKLYEFDFGGANVDAVTQFKSKFRGRRVTYAEFSVYRSRIERMALESFAQFKRFRGAILQRG